MCCSSGEFLEQTANIGRVHLAFARHHVAEDENLSGTEDIRRSPIKGAPIEEEPQIALALLRESADRRAVERQIVVRLEKKFLVVVEHVQATLEVAEQHRDRFDARLVSEVSQAFLLQILHLHAGVPLAFGLEIELFQLGIGERQKIAQFSRHSAALCTTSSESWRHLDRGFRSPKSLSAGCGKQARRFSRHR